MAQKKHSVTLWLKDEDAELVEQYMEEEITEAVFNRFVKEVVSDKLEDLKNPQ